MIFEQMLNGIEYVFIRGNLKGDAGEIAIDSRKCTQGGTFVAITGQVSDGYDYIPAAYENGARYFVIEKDIQDIQRYTDCAFVKVKSTRKILGEVASNYYNNPSSRIKIIGITGTKGKTSVSFLIKSVFENAGYKTGIIGTAGIHYGNKSKDISNTTPEAHLLHKYLGEMASDGVEYVVMEVSSLGLSYNRIGGVQFDTGVFTNLSNDHIGGIEHKDFEEYKQSKGLLFSICNQAVFNIDDSYGGYMISVSTAKQNHTFGIYSEGADVQATGLEYIKKGKKLATGFNTKWGKFTISLPGEFSVYNALSAISVAKLYGIDNDCIQKAFDTPFIKGRMEGCDGPEGYSIYIDYAHNAMSLEALLKTVRCYGDSRIVALFGCGGNRPKMRRYEMGEVAGRYADFTIITTDNPRFEEPDEIIGDIISGIEKTQGQYVAITDRVEALKYAIDNSREGDIILVCGKGHEMYQEIKGVKNYFNEREIIEDYIKSKK